jgi:hypothetical protein
MLFLSEDPRIGQVHGMGIGIGIFVVAFGAVLAFAVDWSIGGLDLENVGWILMIGGVVGLILLSALWKRRLAAEAATPAGKRRIADVAGAPDGPTPLPPVTTMTTVPPLPETVAALTPPAKVVTVRASVPVNPGATSPGRPHRS